MKRLSLPFLLSLAEACAGVSPTSSVEVSSFDGSTSEPETTPSEDVPALPDATRREDLDAPADLLPDAEPDVGPDIGPDIRPDGVGVARCASPPGEPLLTVPTRPLPATLVGAAADFHEAVVYGPETRHRLDVFVAHREGPRPLVVHVHGGGFTSGSRRSVYQNTPEVVRTYIDAGISFATVDYRFLEERETEGVLKPMLDVRRALQFVRYHAASFGVDPARIGLRGASAGAGTSLWIGLGDEACEPESGDPVLAVSTRVSAIAVLDTQSTYDVLRWETDVYGEAFPEVTLEAVVKSDPEAMGRIAQFYGLDPETATLEQLSTDALQVYRAKVDMLSMPGPQDPPVFLSAGGQTGPPRTMGSLLHHPLHAEAMFRALTLAGVPAGLRTRDRLEGDHADTETFLIDHLGAH